MIAAGIVSVKAATYCEISNSLANVVLMLKKLIYEIQREIEKYHRTNITT